MKSNWILVAGLVTAVGIVIFLRRTKSAEAELSQEELEQRRDVWLQRISDHWGEVGTPGWIPEDFNHDGVINVGDLVVVGQTPLENLPPL